MNKDIQAHSWSKHEENDLLADIMAMFRRKKSNKYIAMVINGTNENNKTTTTQQNSNWPLIMFTQISAFYKLLGKTSYNFV